MAQFFGPKLKAAVEAGKVPMSEIDEHARRVLWAMFQTGVVDFPVQKSVVDVEKGLEVAQRIEEKSIVLLKNQGGVLPLDAARVKTIAVIGGHADVGMVSGGGSAQVDPPAGNAIKPPGQGATRWMEPVWFPTSPLKALRAKLPNVKVTWSDGKDLEAAAAAAKAADVAIVFAHQWLSEGMDLPSLALSKDQEELIEKVAGANAKTVVVLETGTAVAMPWLGKVAGVLEAWFAGSSGHKALANVLVGEVNPSAKLAMTFPKSEQDLPHPVIEKLSGKDLWQGPVPGSAAEKYSVVYDEGAKVGYKWYESAGKTPLFPFGFGLSYTTYAYSGLTVDAAKRSVQFTVKNTGKRAGTEIAQVYARVPAGTGEAYKRLVGWSRVTLKPGEAKTVTVEVDIRPLQAFDEAAEQWSLAKGSYQVLVGASSAETPLEAKLELK